MKTTTGQDKYFHYGIVKCMEKKKVDNVNMDQV